MGKAIMFQGTSSHVGKSVFVSALCRILAQDGLKVAPFKSQNMALNSGVTADGQEIGRAQYVQAQAAQIEPIAEINPILLKPVTDTRAQVIVMGRPIATMTAQEYIDYKPQLHSVISASLAELKRSYDVVVIEGAGSPAEINLADHDLVNMYVAKLADAPVVLVADIDRGGVFAYVHGTLRLLAPHDRQRIAGVVVNRFRGDLSRFALGRSMLAELAGVPVAGVIPFFPSLRLPEEDAVPGELLAPTTESDPQKLRIAVIYLPHLSNFTDFDSLRAETDVELTYVRSTRALAGFDLIVIPGSKNTIGDLKAIKASGLADQIVAAATQGTPVFGVCGGFQMLGDRITDASSVESEGGSIEGLGLLTTVTNFRCEKTVARTTGHICYHGPGLLADCQGLTVSGYEIHMGWSESPGLPALLQTTPGHFDGALSASGLVAGTYLHGVFDSAPLRRRILDNLWRLRGDRPQQTSTAVDDGGDLEEAFDAWADHVRCHLDMEWVYQLIR